MLRPLVQKVTSLLSLKSGPGRTMDNSMKHSKTFNVDIGGNEIIITL